MSLSRSTTHRVDPQDLAYVDSDSLGERIQRAFPRAHVVKTLNTMHVEVMVDPGWVPGLHNVFVAGDESGAKAVVRELLRQFGWPDDTIIDLGGIAAARSTEMYAPLLFSIAGTLGSWNFNLAVARP
jgi:predicted dinucleotide-binding enzyme